MVASSRRKAPQLTLHANDPRLDPEVLQAARLLAAYQQATHRPPKPLGQPPAPRPVPQARTGRRKVVQR